MFSLDLFLVLAATFNSDQCTLGNKLRHQCCFCSYVFYCTSVVSVKKRNQCLHARRGLNNQMKLSRDLLYCGGRVSGLKASPGGRVIVVYTDRILLSYVP
ncbi:hypothetical protein PR003_g30113 [Phytophthora rubi]|uniref:Secreted protein n=1 Tax=Phytophthora rubi TaxID=129364 RepID=A0A6A4BCH4_9STRA|nr:hypothetical protein PR003_g30113 [Phytophthora rubi]